MENRQAAFPRSQENFEGTDIQQGLSKRAFLAGQIMAAMNANPQEPKDWPDERVYRTRAARAVAQADALMKSLNE